MGKLKKIIKKSIVISVLKTEGCYPRYELVLPKIRTRVTQDTNSCYPRYELAQVLEVVMYVLAHYSNACYSP